MQHRKRKSCECVRWEPQTQPPVGPAPTGRASLEGTLPIGDEPTGWEEALGVVSAQPAVKLAGSVNSGCWVS